MNTYEIGDTYELDGRIYIELLELGEDMEIVGERLLEADQARACDDEATRLLIADFDI